MVRILSKRTGKMWSSYEEYLKIEIEPAFIRIRRYGDRHGKSTHKVIDRDSLLKYISSVTGTENNGLVNEIVRTEDYKSLIEDNFKDSRKEEHVLKKDVVVVQPHEKVFYRRLSKRELISRRSAMKKELKQIERELGRRKVKIRGIR